MKTICKEFHLGSGDSVRTMNEWFLLHSDDINIRTISQDGNTVLVFYEEEPPDEASQTLRFNIGTCKVAQVIDRYRRKCALDDTELKHDQGTLKDVLTEKQRR